MYTPQVSEAIQQAGYVNVSLRRWRLNLEFMNTCDSHKHVKDCHHQKKIWVLERTPEAIFLKFFAYFLHDEASTQCIW